MARLKERYQKEVAPAIAKEFGIENPMAVPRLDKIVLNMGMDEAVANAKVLDTAVVEKGAIAGQEPLITSGQQANARLHQPQESTNAGHGYQPTADIIDTC